MLRLIANDTCMQEVRTVIYVRLSLDIAYLANGARHSMRAQILAAEPSGPLTADWELQGTTPSMAPKCTEDAKGFDPMLLLSEVCCAPAIPRLLITDCLHLSVQLPFACRILMTRPIVTLDPYVMMGTSHFTYRT